MDVLTPEQRSYNMSRIRGKNTAPELLLRRGLHAAGLRFRLHVRELPGHPDMVFPRYQTVGFVHGCFWHGHDCPLFKLPATRRDFWSAKIAVNRVRDDRNHDALVSRGWRILTIWECALKGRGKRPLPEVLTACAEFIRGSASDVQISFAPDSSPRR